MSLPLNPAMAATFAPPVMEARRWLQGVAFPPERPLINVSQAAPVESPPLGLRQALAEAALSEGGAPRSRRNGRPPMAVRSAPIR